MHSLYYMGQVFKEIRVGRNLSLKDATGDTFSVSTLSRFEKGESDLSAQKLLLALENIRTDLPEFLYLIRGYQPSEYALLKKKIWQAQERKDKEALWQLYQEAMALYQKETTQKYHLLNALIIKSHIVFFDDEVLASKEELDFLYDYLFSVEIWGGYELRLFCDVAPLLPLDLYFRYTREMLKRLDFFEEVIENRQYLSTILLNGFFKAIDEKHHARAAYFKKQIDHRFFEENELYFRVVYLFACGQYECLLGEYEQGDHKMIEAIQILNRLNCSQSAAYYEKGRQDFLNICK